MRNAIFEFLAFWLAQAGYHFHDDESKFKDQFCGPLYLSDAILMRVILVEVIDVTASESKSLHDVCKGTKQLVDVRTYCTN